MWHCPPFNPVCLSSPTPRHQCGSSIASPRSFLNPPRYILPPPFFLPTSHCVVNALFRGHLVSISSLHPIPRPLVLISFSPLVVCQYSPFFPSGTLFCTSSFFFLPRFPATLYLCDAYCLRFLFISRHLHDHLLLSMSLPHLLLSPRSVPVLRSGIDALVHSL